MHPTAVRRNLDEAGHESRGDRVGEGCGIPVHQHLGSAHEPAPRRREVDVVRGAAGVAAVRLAARVAAAGFAAGVGVVRPAARVGVVGLLAGVAVVRLRGGVALALAAAPVPAAFVVVGTAALPPGAAPAFFLADVLADCAAVLRTAAAFCALLRTRHAVRRAALST